MVIFDISPDVSEEFPVVSVVGPNKKIDCEGSKCIADSDIQNLAHKSGEAENGRV